MSHMTDKLIIKLPFPGFYESLYSSEVDSVEEREVEYIVEREEEERAPELRLEARDIAECFFDCTDYSVAYHKIAEGYVEAFSSYVGEELDLKLDLEFEAMKSPREYNFETDRLFAYISADVVAELFKRSEADNHAELARVIRERFTSRSGFISFYETDLAGWIAKPLADWDHNELETLLMAVMRLHNVDPRDDDLAIYYAVSEGETFYSAWQDAVDWSKFEAKLAELRADKEAELHAADPDYVAPEPRCPFTLDLFANS